jgi:protein gp37/ParB-like chromosome segregation protein Spo0J
MTADFSPYRVHPLAEAFPLIEGEEFEKLVQDIREHGLWTPIMLTADESTIVDGRNRYRACIEALVDPVFKSLPESFTEKQIGDYILSENLHRRHMNAGQVAFVGLRFEEYYADLAKKWKAQRERDENGRLTSKPIPADLPEQVGRQRESREQAAKVVGASGRAVQQAKTVQQDAPDLAAQVRRGDLALDNAYKQTRARVTEQRKREPEPEKLKKRTEPIMLTLRTSAGDEVKYPQPASKSTFNRTAGDGISWAGWSWNPVTGCLHGCNYCYAREIATSERYAAAYPVGFTPLFHHERLSAPGDTVIPARYRNDAHVSCDRGDCEVCAHRRVFVCSMADLYGRWVPDEWIQQVHDSMLKAPHWQYITLTKFPSRYVGLDLPPRAWVGTSVDEQKRVRLAEDAFRKIDNVKVKWLSLEPLLEPLEFTDLSMFDWVVIGAQTETRQPDKVVPAFAPPLEWVSKIVSQAREAGCKVHCKPNLMGKTDSQHPGMALPNEYPV